MERYRAIEQYVWKILDGLVLNCGLEVTISDRRGREIVIPKPKGSQRVKTLREQSFQVGGKYSTPCPNTSEIWKGWVSRNSNSSWTNTLNFYQMNPKFQVIFQERVTNTQQFHLTQLSIIPDQEIEDLVDAGGSSNPPSITIWQRIQSIDCDNVQLLKQ